MNFVEKSKGKISKDRVPLGLEVPFYGLTFPCLLHPFRLSEIHGLL